MYIDVAGNSLKRMCVNAEGYRKSRLAQELMGWNE
jgi:hypothetical protein